MKASLIISLLLICLLGFIFRQKIIYLFSSPRPASPIESVVKSITPKPKDIEIIAQNISIPWEIAFLPDGDMLVTERSGQLLKIGTGTKVVSQIQGVKHIGEGGLLGMALHPQFVRNHFIYLYSTTQKSDGITNRVERYQMQNDTLIDRKVILEGIKGSANHDGGRMAFGRDGLLYITTGDAENSKLAQNPESLNGKILRIRDDGSIPSDNPFGNAVYSLGHRNPQGLAWDKSGNLWQTEHGPSGTQTGYDEVNLIVIGGNYGWPEIKGDQTKPGLISPVIQSGSRDTWAPSGLIHLNGNLFFSGLRGEALYKAKIVSGNRLELSVYFKKEFGRIRAVVVGPDGFIYVSTSNTDGRGDPKPNDDKIIKINPDILK